VLIDQARKIPNGPTDAFDREQNLLAWIEANFKKYGDLYRATVFGKNVYVASSPEYAQHVLRDNWENYRKGQAIKRVGILLGNGLMVSEGDFWKNQRRMVQPAFHRNAIAGLYEMMKVANFILLKRWENSARQGESVNVTSDTSLLVLEITLRAMFGEDYPQVAPSFNLLHDEPARSLRFAQAFADTRHVVVELMDRRLRDKSNRADILGLLMNARGQGGLSMPDDQVVKETMTIVVAGHETTAGTLNMIWYLVSQNQEVEMRLSEELSGLKCGKFPDMEALPNFPYTRLVIDEALRLYPPGWLMTRRAIEDDYLGEYYVPAGTEVYISPYVIQRHPALWVEPNSFNPERFQSTDVREKRSAAMLPFSAGPRNCIGEVFARTEMQVHLMTVASRIRLAYINRDPLKFEAGVNLRSRHDFMMLPEIKTF
jgi:cytochrome P450